MRENRSQGGVELDFKFRISICNDMKSLYLVKYSEGAMMMRKEE